MVHAKDSKAAVTIAAVARAVFPPPGAFDAKAFVAAPITENSPGVKLRRAHDLYKKAVSR